ncbi:CLUMA_CG004882, isoform A [Clunio marinus]|uniref:CLUMA_CG004882, isoform A n=1 Tax=Clunio marinus TaxID=568069 RepID=A0A1J1HT12_9DIPT|nr:CLUMA_CG004882, isoform A [Clunio marinus]
MAIQTSLSLVISMLSAILIFSSMQFCKQLFLSSQMLTIFAGIVGSWFFIMLLTTISNLEAVVLGKGFQARWPEVIISLLSACFACSTIHRVSVTTCLLTSLIGLYYINRISQNFHSTPVTVDTGISKKKKK